MTREEFSEKAKIVARDFENYNEEESQDFLSIRATSFQLPFGELAEGTVKNNEIIFDSKVFASLDENENIIEYNNLIEGYTTVSFGGNPCIFQNKDKSFTIVPGFGLKQGDFEFYPSNGKTPARLVFNKMPKPSKKMKSLIKDHHGQMVLSGMSRFDRGPFDKKYKDLMDKHKKKFDNDQRAQAYYDLSNYVPLDDKYKSCRSCLAGLCTKCKDIHDGFNHVCDAWTFDLLDEFSTDFNIDTHDTLEDKVKKTYNDLMKSYDLHFEKAKKAEEEVKGLVITPFTEEQLKVHEARQAKRQEFKSKLESCWVRHDASEFSKPQDGELSFGLSYSEFDREKAKELFKGECVMSGTIDMLGLGVN